MSNDLAKLKDQLGKIMNKADSYEKNVKSHQLVSDQSILQGS
jgi:hypothetical protein